MEEKIFQGYVYRRAGPDQPWQLAGPATAQPAQRGTVLSDPNRAREESRKDEDQQLQRGQYDLSRDSAGRSQAKDRIDNPQSLRKEYAALPEVKEYKIASQMAAAALGTDDSPQGDIALTYAFAKAMDPGSVVRDQESAVITNSQPWFQSAAAQVKKQFGMDGAGNFSPDARRRIRLEIIRNLSSRRPLYDARRAEMAEVAKINGIDAREVVGKDDTQVFSGAFRKFAEKHGDEGDVIYNLIGGDPIKPEQPKAAGAGATESAIPIPPEMQQEHSAYLAKNWGKLEPQDYAAFRINLDKKYGFGSDPEAYAADVPELNKRAAAGGSSIGLHVPSVKKELSSFDQFRNNMLSNPVGAATAGGLNAAGIGIPSLAAPAQMQALRDEYPVSS
ncbi:MAG: hypothetical protein EON59_05440, partial [Alphaproteobacteria bacterium]